MDAKKLAALLAFSLLLPRGYAQTTPLNSSAPPPAQKSEIPTIVSNVDEVTLDLVVRDKKNKPVLDLKPGDIAVADSGSAVKLSDLRLVTGTDHPITLLFDPLDTSGATNARNVARKILKLVPASGFSFSVLTIAGRLHLLQEFTGDRTAIDRAVKAATAVEENGKSADLALPEKELLSVARTGSHLSGAKASSEDRTAAQVMLASLQESQRIMLEQHTQPSLAGLLALARTQRQIHGRKVIIYFTEGLPPDASAKDMLISIAAAANRAGISIYVIDKTAVDTKVMEGMSSAIAMGGLATYNVQHPLPTGPAADYPRPYGPGMIPMYNDQVNRIEIEETNIGKNPVAQLAANTGGAYIFSEDNLKKPIQQLIENVTSYYEASYVPPLHEYDGKFRPVAVQPLRKGLQIHSRAGYFAVPPDAGAGIRPFEAPLLKVLSESELPRDLEFHSAVLRLGDLPTGNENALVIEVPLDGLETRDDPNANLYSLHVSIVAQIKNKAGEVTEHFSEDVPRHGSLDSKRSAQSESIIMQRHFTAAPGQYVMETVVLDRNSEKAGARRQEFEIPSEAAGPSLGDVAMVRHLDPMPAEMESAEPMQYGKGKVVPSISGRVPHGAKQISFFFMVHPDPSSSEQPTLEMEVLKSHEAIAQVPLHLAKMNGPGSIPYLASIRSTSLPSGDYEVIERLTQGGKSTERGLEFRIDGPELATATTPDSATGAVQPQNKARELATSSDQLPETGGHDGRHLVITSLPAGAVPPPSMDDLDTIIAGARKRAIEYSQSLPNFICIEVTSRSVDQSGNGNWKHRDSIAELLTYHDRQEARSTLEVNGKRSSLKRADMNATWPISVGEFGALLNLVFSPSSKTEFAWKEAGSLAGGGGSLQVLTYRVTRENATLDLSESNNTIGVGFHGLVYIDAATSGIRRITVAADGLPRDFSMHAAAMTVDYDYVAIAGRDYLLPVSSTVSLQRHRKQIELNEIAFRNYRRFASRTKVKMVQ